MIQSLFRRDDAVKGKLEEEGRAIEIIKNGCTKLMRNLVSCAPTDRRRSVLSSLINCFE